MKAKYSVSVLGQFFSGVTEQTFIGELGVADPDLIEYLSALLTRFIHRDDIYLKDTAGRRLRDVADMMAEAERDDVTSERRRTIFRHIGDFTLFWTGVFPEFLESRQSGLGDALSNYTEHGKRSYYLASTYSDSPYTREAPVLRRLSDQFELCATGLRKVRTQWDHLPES